MSARMRRVYLLRHAKTEAAAASGEDFDRALTPRGVRAALAIGEYMRQRAYDAEIVLCSPARRARETLDIVRTRQRKLGRAQYPQALYLAPPETLQEQLARLPARVGAVLVIGHNPGLQQFALALAGTGAAEALSAMHGKFTTCSLAAVEMALPDWRALGAGTGKLVDFVSPKQIV